MALKDWIKRKSNEWWNSMKLEMLKITTRMPGYSIVLFKKKEVLLINIVKTKKEALQVVRAYMRKH